MDCNKRDCCDTCIRIGNTVTGQPGTAASVTNSGSCCCPVLNFTIPEGERGQDGASATITIGTTTTGSPGSPASVTNSGTAQNSILNFTIPAGQNGKTPVVTVGTTTTLNAGQPATATAIPTSDGIQIDFGIPQGEPGNTAKESFASFFNYGTLFNNGSQLPFYPVVTDITGQIVQVSQEQISLEAGYYLVSYHVSAILSDAGYMQITPFYSSTSHLELGIYFLTPEGRSTANGSNTIIIYIPEKTNFTLTYNSNVSSRDGAATLSILKLQR